MLGQHQARILDIATLVLRSWGRLVAAVCLGLSAALAAVHHLPRTYEASTKIFVAPQKIPAEYVRTTVTEDATARLPALESAVTSRPYLSRLVAEVYPDVPEGPERERLIHEIRRQIVVDLNRGLIELGVRDRDPARAAEIANRLAAMYIEENARYRASRAGETTRTLEQLAEIARRELSKRDREIAEFKERHLYELGDHKDANLRLLEARQRELESTEASLAQARERLRTLLARQAALTRPAEEGEEGEEPVVPMDPTLARVEQLQQQLEALRSRYEEDHPEVRRKRKELDEILAGREAGGQEAPAVLARPGLATLQAEIGVVQAEIARLETQRERHRSQIDIYEARIEATPRVERELADLMKGYDVLLKQYQDYQAKVESAKGAQMIEEARKGEQYEIIEKAVPPSFPVEPNPLLVHLAAVGVFGFLCAGPLVLRALLYPPIVSESNFRTISKAPVLVSIPVIDTPEARLRRRRRLAANAILSSLSLAIYAAAIGWFTELV